MKDNANLEDMLIELRDKHHQLRIMFIEKHKICVDLYRYFFYWQLNKPFSEQSEETKETLNKIL